MILAQLLISLDLVGLQGSKIVYNLAFSAPTIILLLSSTYIVLQSICNVHRQSPIKHLKLAVKFASLNGHTSSPEANHETNDKKLKKCG